MAFPPLLHPGGVKEQWRYADIPTLPRGTSRVTVAGQRLIFTGFPSVGPTFPTYFVSLSAHRLLQRWADVTNPRAQRGFVSQCT